MFVGLEQCGPGLSAWGRFFYARENDPTLLICGKGSGEAQSRQKHDGLFWVAGIFVEGRCYAPPPAPDRAEQNVQRGDAPCLSFNQDESGPVDREKPFGYAFEF